MTKPSRAVPPARRGATVESKGPLRGVELDANRRRGGRRLHRIKGLEYDHVILVVHDPDGPVPDELIYVGASRATMSLTIIGPPDVGRRLGIDAAT